MIGGNFLHFYQMKSNDDTALVSSIHTRLIMIKYTYDVLNIDDPMKAYQKIPLNNIEELTRSWRDTMREIFSPVYFFDDETWNDNFKLLSKVMDLMLGMSLVIEGDYVISTSLDGRDEDLPDILEKELWFCKKLEENK